MSSENKLVSAAGRGKLDLVTDLLDQGANLEASGGYVSLSDYNVLAEKHAHVD